MASIADILVNIQAQDNVTPVAQQIQGSMSSMGGGIRGTVSELGSIFRGLNGMVMGVFGMYGLSSFKNMTYGTAVARQEVKNLYDSSVGLGDQADALWDKMDDLTNHGYVSLDQLTQAMSVFKMSTGASIEELDQLAPLMDSIGNRAILMGYDTNRQQLLMQSMGDALNGNFRMLKNAFGVTSDKLKKMGWKGTSDDVKGFVNALDAYLNKSGQTNNLLDSTQGKVISLQKRFRIAGRSMGNAMLPYINAIMDSFTKLNSESDDMLAKMVILSTGFMSGFASILPTISPLLQVYDFINKRLAFSLNLGARTRGDIKLITTLLNPLTSRLSRVRFALNELVQIPLKNYLFEGSNAMLNFSKTPIGRVFDSISSSATRMKSSLGLANVFEKLTSSTLKYTKIPIANALHKANAGVGNLFNRYEKLYNVYGRVELRGKANVLMMGIREQLIKRNSNVIKEVALAEGFLSEELVRGAIAHTTSSLAIDEETIAYGVNNGVKEVANAVSFVGTEAKIAEGIATADMNTQIALQNALKLFEMGIIDEEILARLMLKMGIIDETVAREMGLVVTEEEIVAKGVLGGVLAWVTALEWASLLPILLIVGALVGLFLIIDQIGKSLGWWDNWGEMIEAVWSGIQRLWSAFINNPNVQGFIKDIQGVFGQLGGVITDVALAVMKFFGWEDNGEEVDIVRMIIDAFGLLGKVLGDVTNAVKRHFMMIWSIIGPIAGFIWEALKTIVCILIGCSPGIVPALQSVYETFIRIFGGIASFLTNPIGTITRLLGGLNGNLFTIARKLGLSLWNGLNSILMGIPQKVFNTFMTMINRIANLPQQVFDSAQKMGQDIYSGIDDGVSYWTGGMIHLPGMENKNAKSNAKTMGNVNKNYNNTSQKKVGHTFNIGTGAIQLDARNLTTKESKQVMINALEGLTTYETVHTKKASGQ